MKKNIFLLSLFFCLSFSTLIFSDVYIGLIGGGTAGFDLKNSAIDTSTGYYIGGRIGMRCFPLIRIEEEISYQFSDIHSISKHGFHLKHVHGHVNSWAFMTNALVDLDCPFIVSPYFGGGVGYAHENGKGKGKITYMQESHAKMKINQHSFAWQGLVGIKYCVCFGFEASVEYRYFKIKDTEANHKLGIALTKLF